MSAVAANKDPGVVSQVGNPLLGQIRDFIESDEPAPIDPLGIVTRAIRGRIRSIGLVCVAVALLFSVTAWVAVSPEYQSTSVVRILPREAKLLYNDADDSRLRLYDAFTNAEVHLMQSRTILENAWNTMHDHFHEVQEQGYTLPGDAGELGKLIGITNRKGLVTVTANSPNPTLAAAAVNGVIGAYESYKSNARERSNELRLNELQELERQLTATLEDLDARYLEIGGEHDIASLSKAHIAKTAQLEVLEERIGELDNTIAQFQETGAMGADDIRNAEIQRSLILDQAMAEMTYDRARRLAELSTLRNRYQPTHSRVVTAQLELETLEGAISERKEQITTLGNVGALTGGTSQTTQQSLDELETVRKKLMDRRMLLRTEAGELIGKLVKIRRVVTEQDRVGAVLEETKDALDEVIVESRAGLSRSIDLIAEAKVPKQPISDKRKPLALGAGMFGALATLVGFILLSLINPRVRYTDDLRPGVHRKIALAMRGEREDEAELTRVALKLRNEVDIRRPEADGPIVIAVSGTTSNTRAARISVALSDAYAAGKGSVLLVDANARSQVTEQFSTGHHAGLAGVMARSARLEDTVEPLELNQGTVELLGSGIPEDGHTADPVAAYTLRDFRTLIDAAKARYDHVVIDLGEMAASRHSALVASVVDQLILVTTEGDLKRIISDATELLDRFSPERHFIIFDAARPLDPMLQREDAAASVPDWKARLFKRFNPPLEA